MGEYGTPTTRVANAQPMNKISMKTQTSVNVLEEGFSIPHQLHVVAHLGEHGIHTMKNATVHNQIKYGIIRRTSANALVGGFGILLPKIASALVVDHGTVLKKFVFVNMEKRLTKKITSAYVKMEKFGSWKKMNVHVRRTTNGMELFVKQKISHAKSVRNGTDWNAYHIAKSMNSWLKSHARFAVIDMKFGTTINKNV